MYCYCLKIGGIIVRLGGIVKGFGMIYLNMVIMFGVYLIMI